MPKLTDKQRHLARLLARGNLSQRECADLAGYHGTQQAAHNLATRPAVVAEVARLTASSGHPRPVDPGSPPPPIDLIAEAEKAVRQAKTPGAHLRAVGLLASLTRFGTGDHRKPAVDDRRSVQPSVGTPASRAAARAADRLRAAEDEAAWEKRMEADDKLFAALASGEPADLTPEQEAEFQRQLAAEGSPMMTYPSAVRPLPAEPPDTRAYETRSRVVAEVRKSIK